MIGWLLGCSLGDCEGVCGRALSRQVACMDERGLDWSTSAYQDESDFLNGCATWVWEVQELGRDECLEMDQAITSGTCEDFDMAWQL